MSLRKLLLCTTLSSVLLFSFASSVFASPSSDFLTLINNYRASKGIAKLTWDQKLNSASCWMASDMAAKGYFSHTDSLGRDPFQRMDSFGVSGGSRGENIASLTNQANSAKKVFDGWKASSGHNANMLSSSYTRIGIGFDYRSSNKTYYWVTDFASGNAVVATDSCNSPTPTPTPAPKPAPKVPPAPKPTPAPTPTAAPIESKPPVATPSAILYSTDSAKIATPSSASAKPYYPKPQTPKITSLLASSKDLSFVTWIVFIFLFNLGVIVPTSLFLLNQKKFHRFATALNKIA